MSSEPELTMPEHPVFPIDLDLDAMSSRDKADEHRARTILDAIHRDERMPTEDEAALLHAMADRHALLTELQTARRDRDSARNTVLTVAQLVPRWNDPRLRGDEFARGLRAASSTLAEVLARQMLRD